MFASSPWRSRRGGGDDAARRRCRCAQRSDDLKAEAERDEDLEDGEIEDDDGDDGAVAPPPPQSPTTKPVAPAAAVVVGPPQTPPVERFGAPAGVGDKKKRHLTEAEKSVMRLHKLERLEREKREKYRREQALMHPPIEPEEDFATSLEKAIAKVLKKDKPETAAEPADVGVVEEKPHGKKRKKKEKHNKKNKKNKQDQAARFVDEPMDDVGTYGGGGGYSETTMLSNLADDGDGQQYAPSSTNYEDDSYDSESSAERNNALAAAAAAAGDGRPGRRKHGKRQHDRSGGRKFRDKSRDRNRDADKRQKVSLKRNNGICIYYLQGLCEDTNCTYSHDAVQPMKLELCKFYLLDCCAKGDKCLYMHSDFPCKYYHTGIPCPHLDNCKFAHGGPLSDGLRQILFKHIETAPKEILGNFPRLSRENASLMIVQAQKQLEGKYGPAKPDNEQQDAGKGGGESSLFDLNFPGQSDSGLSEDGMSSSGGGGGGKRDKRHRPSRWQDPDPVDKDKTKGGGPLGFGGKGAFKDQDMRFNSNGDVDMRTLNMGQPPPNMLTHQPPPNMFDRPPPSIDVLMNPSVPPPNRAPLADGGGNVVDIEKYKMEAARMLSGVGASSSAAVVDASKMDTDIRRFDVEMMLKDSVRNQMSNLSPTDDDEGENQLQIVMDDEEQPAASTPEEPKASTVIDLLPKTQRDLFKRIQAQQKEQSNEEERARASDAYNDANIDWYSDDEDDNKLTIRDDYEDAAKPSSADEPPTNEARPPPQQQVDLSKIDISAEVSKLLTTIQSTLAEPKKEPRDPRAAAAGNSPRRDPRLASDPRRARVGSAEERAGVSIYEQGSLADAGKDVDLRSGDQDLRFGDTDFRTNVGRPDVDLRQLGLPFKGMQNYTPAMEIDGSINSHPPIQWRTVLVEIPKPDYTGLKLSATEAQTTGDPRLRKIFRLSTEEKDSPASPKESPKAPTVRIDPRRKKMEAEAAKVAPPEPSIGGMTYTQQVSMLQASPFYQSLTSQQKVMLNQELATRNDQTGQSDPIVSAMLQNLGLISPSTQSTGGQSQAVNILANVSNMGFPNAGPMMPNAGPGIIPPGPGLLGPGPPNMPPEFPMNFDPRNGGMMGNGPPPPPPFGNFPPDGGNFPGGGGFGDDGFFPDQGGFNNGGAGNQNRDRGFRDRHRRGRNTGNNRNRNFFRRHNRNRNSPP